MKKNILVSLAGLALLSVGLVQSNDVQASAVRIGRNAYLSHNAYVYNAKGQKLSSGSVKNGTSFKVLAIKKIHGKKYVQIGKNEFIKLSNFTKSSTSTGADASTVLVGKNSYVYNAKGHRVGKKMVKHGKVVPILSTVTIKGKKYVQIGRNQFIRFNNVDWNAGADDSVSNVTKSASNNKNSGTPVASTSNSQNSAPVNNNTSSSASGNTSTNNSSTGNTTSSQNDDNGEEVVDDDDGIPVKTLICLHNSYTYDQNGKRNLGGFVIKGRKYDIEADKNGKFKFTVNNDEFYRIRTLDYEDNWRYDYIPVSAFEKTGTDQQFNPAKTEDLIKFGRSLDNYQANYLTFLYSSQNKQNAYNKAYSDARRVASSRWSSDSDMQVALKQLENSINNLDGKPVTVKGNYYSKFNLDDGQKNTIIALANKIFHTNDAHFAGDDVSTIYYTQGDNPTSTNTSRFIKFEN